MNLLDERKELLAKLSKGENRIKEINAELSEFTPYEERDTGAQYFRGYAGVIADELDTLEYDQKDLAGKLELVEGELDNQGLLTPEMWMESEKWL